ncbi:MAG: OmpA family protein [Bacteroidales bacterium]|jgi:OOP family OmpA-OmpF porin|nr:OmpA family protein [Bacteroidales bacterium]
MKTKLVILFALLIGAASLQAQVDVDVKGKVTNQADNRANKHTDNAIDKGFDKIEDGVKGLFKKRKNKKGEDDSAEDENAQTQGNSTDSNENNQGNNDAEVADNTPQMDVQWSKFDFVPGDNIIFEDGPSANEENGEFPSRWDLDAGQVEIASVNGEAVIMFLDGGKIIPYLKNSDKDYLPEVFTIEFDFYKPAGGNRITVYLTDQKNQRGEGVYDDAQDMDITPIRVDAPGGITAEHSSRDASYCDIGRWTHVSIAYTKGKLKVYLDDTRLINIPHYEFNPTGFTFYPYWADAAEDLPYYAKNFRIAEGGVKYYDRAMQDGKIVVNGIRFDVGKATLKPESMGPINEIYDLMDKNPEISFSVEGHTDSDGNDETNQTLSEERAKTVMNKLIEMGIDKSRLKSTGFGESKPIAGNDSAEGKANNRRVEFVKF